MASPSKTLLIIVLAALLLPEALLAAKKAPPRPERVCVPAENGRDWECGTSDNPPPERALPAPASAPSASAPPAYLLAPDTSEDSPPSSIEPLVEPERASVETLEPSPEPPSQSELNAATPPPPSSIAAPETDSYGSAAPAPVPVATPAPEPARVAPAASAIRAERAATPSKSADDQVRPAVASEPVRATEPENPPPTARSSSAAASSQPPVEAKPSEAVAQPVAATPAATSLPLPVLAGAAEFLRLPADGYTLQLALDSSAQSFAALAQRLGLDPSDTFVLHLAGETGRLAVLVHGRYADGTAARAALARLTGQVALQAAWPRRIAPLHSELRRSDN